MENSIVDQQRRKFNVDFDNNFIILCVLFGFRKKSTI